MRGSKMKDDSPKLPAISLKMAGGLILLAAACRLLLLPLPNFAPVAAMALFGGAVMGRPLFAFGLPLLGLALSDLLVNAVMVGTPLAVPDPWVYGSFILVGLLGFAFRRRQTMGRLAGASLAGSLLFFALTNLGVWLGGQMYPLTAQGLAACYTAALPFLGNTVAGDLIWNGLLFGAYFGVRRMVLTRAAV
ncbi:MAG: DUF6580 family putative transport protein, partial [Acidobacteriota bacterium]